MPELFLLHKSHKEWPGIETGVAAPLIGSTNEEKQSHKNFVVTRTCKAKHHTINSRVWTLMAPDELLYSAEGGGIINKYPSGGMLLM